MARETLKNRRPCETLRIECQGVFMSMTVGYYPDGRPAEVFVSDIKSGVTADAIARDAAIAISISLQFGADVTVLAHTVTRNEDGSPSSFMGALVDQLAKDRRDMDHG